MHCPRDLGKEPPKLAQCVSGGGVLSIRFKMSKLDIGLGAQVPLLVASEVTRGIFRIYLQTALGWDEGSVLLG